MTRRPARLDPPEVGCDARRALAWPSNEPWLVQEESRMDRRLVYSLGIGFSITAGLILVSAVGFVGCGKGDPGTGKVVDMTSYDPFEPAPECRPDDLPVKPLSGSRQFVIN